MEWVWEWSDMNSGFWFAVFPPIVCVSGVIRQNDDTDEVPHFDYRRLCTRERWMEKKSVGPE